MYEVERDEFGDVTFTFLAPCEIYNVYRANGRYAGTLKLVGVGETWSPGLSRDWGIRRDPGAGDYHEVDDFMV